MLRAPIRAPAETTAPAATDTPRPSRAVRWTCAPRATPARGRGAGRNEVSQTASAAPGEGTTTAGRPAARLWPGTRNAPAALAAAAEAYRASVTNERSAGPASAS